MNTRLGRPSYTRSRLACPLSVSACPAHHSRRLSGCRDTVVALRDFWRSLDQLRSIGDNQILEACDKLLAELR
jgi:hypothetical protein